MKHALHCPASLSGLALILALLAGCGARPTADPALEERAHVLRVALGDLRARPGAERLAADFERASLWLQRAEIVRASEAPDRARVALSLEAAEVQLARIKAGLARYGAEADLAQRQTRYADQSRRIEDYRRQTEAVGGAQEANR